MKRDNIEEEGKKRYFLLEKLFGGLSKNGALGKEAREHVALNCDNIYISDQSLSRVRLFSTP